MAEKTLWTVTVPLATRSMGDVERELRDKLAILISSTMRYPTDSVIYEACVPHVAAMASESEDGPCTVEIERLRGAADASIVALVTLTVGSETKTREVEQAEVTKAQATVRQRETA